MNLRGIKKKMRLRGLDIQWVLTEGKQPEGALATTTVNVWE